MEHSYFIHFFVALFAITNPIGNLAIFIGLTSDYPSSEQRRAAFVTALATLISLWVSLWLGLDVLKMFGISVPAFEVAGGLVIVLIGLSMLHSETSKVSHTDGEHQAALAKTSIAVIPMAIPIVAGPGAMTTVILSAQGAATLMDKLILSGECILIALLVAIVFYFAGFIGKLLGHSGIKITSRIMGLILTAIAVSMLANGLKNLFPALAG